MIKACLVSYRIRFAVVVVVAWRTVLAAVRNVVVVEAVRKAVADTAQGNTSLVGSSWAASAPLVNNFGFEGKTPNNFLVGPFVLLVASCCHSHTSSV